MTVLVSLLSMFARSCVEVAALGPREPRRESASGAGLRLVGVGVDLSSAARSAETTVNTWEDIPPASKDYAASRDVLRVRIEALLKVLRHEEGRR